MEPKRYTEFQRECALSFYPINKAIDHHTDFEKWTSIYDFGRNNLPKDLQLCIVVGLYGDVYIARFYEHYRITSIDGVHDYFDAFVVYTDSIELVTKNEETGEYEPFVIEGRPVIQDPKLWRPVPKDLLKILDTLHNEFDVVSKREEEDRKLKEKIQGWIDSAKEDNGKKDSEE